MQPQSPLLLLATAIRLAFLRQLKPEECMRLFKIVYASDEVRLEELLVETQNLNTHSLNLSYCIDNEQISPLMVAADGGPVKMVKQLVEACDEETLHLVDKYNRNAVQFACNHDSPEVLQVLIDAKISIRNIGTDGSTALIVACSNGYKNLVEKLLDQLDLETINHLSNEAIGRRTALMAAASANNPAVIEMLLAKGADITLKDSDGFSVLDRAILTNSSDAIGVLTDFVIKKQDWDAFPVEFFSNAISYAWQTRKVEVWNKLNAALAAKTSHKSASSENKAVCQF